MSRQVVYRLILKMLVAGTPLDLFFVGELVGIAKKLKPSNETEHQLKSIINQIAMMTFQQYAGATNVNWGVKATMNSITSYLRDAGLIQIQSE